MAPEYSGKNREFLLGLHAFSEEIQGSSTDGVSSSL